MPLSAAEKQRRYRQKRDANPERRAEYLQKEKESWETKKLTGKVKMAGEMNDREKRKIRRYWRVNRAKNRKKQKDLATTLTPPCSPGPGISPPPSTCQSQGGKQRRRKNRNKILKKLNDIKLQLNHQKRETAKYKKRWQRLLNSGKPAETPRPKTRRLLQYASKSTVKRTLLFHNVLAHQIKEKYAATKQEHLKQTYVDWIYCKEILITTPHAGTIRIFVKMLAQARHHKKQCWG